MAQLIVRLRDRELQRFPITSVVTRIGRDAANDIVIANDGISRHHATVRYEPADRVFVVHDASSSNGLYVRGRPTPYARLTDGDECLLGKFTLLFLKEGGAPVEQLLPDPIDAAAKARPVHEPLPTIAIYAARGRGIGPRASTSSAPPPSLASTPPVAPPAPAPALRSETGSDAIEVQAKLMRQMMAIMVVLLAVLIALVALLLKR